MRNEIINKIKNASIKPSYNKFKRKIEHNVPEIAAVIDYNYPSQYSSIMAVFLCCRISRLIPH